MIVMNNTIIVTGYHDCKAMVCRLLDSRGM